MDAETQQRLWLKKRELHAETMQSHVMKLVEMIEAGLIPEEVLEHLECALYHMWSSLFDGIPKPPSMM